jgi:D-arabinose 1-dehydrogenase-like Zn-dependent alcohol dehydrogenase
MAVKLAVSMGAEVTMLSHTAAKATDAKDSVHINLY